jgi:ABC-2 type transport system ATP-binding protein
VIEVRNLVKNYDGTQALRGISFAVRDGDIFGFIGPNGAGKTTTIRILATLLNPTSGSARVDGHCVVNHPERVRRMIGYMPDYYGVYEGISVLEYLLFFAGAYHLAWAHRQRIVADVMELTDLAPHRDRLVSGLSKGMKQRLCLAKTLLHDPKFLILDEPASGLDPRARVELRVLLKELARMGKTIFISSHILTELSDICNTVGIIEKGEILACGDVDTIREKLSPHRVLTVEVLEGAEEAGALAARHPDVIGVEVQGNTVRVDFRGERPAIAALVRRLVEGGTPLVGVQEEKQDLEDLFMKITKGELA